MFGSYLLCPVDPVLFMFQLDKYWTDFEFEFSATNFEIILEITDT